MEDITDTKKRIKQLNKVSTLNYLFIIGFASAWTILLYSEGFEAKIISDRFLFFMSLLQQITYCLMIFLYLLDSNILFDYLRFFLFFLGILTLTDLILFIVTICVQEDPLSQKYVFSYEILGFMFLTFLTMWIQSILLPKIREIEYRIANYEFNLLFQNAQQKKQEGIQQRLLEIQSLDQSQIDLIYGNTCTICSEVCNLQEKAVQLKCLHIFHGKCICQWLLEESCCPNCRDEVF